MIQSAFAAVRTLLLGAVVIVAGWWTFFLREKLQAGDRALEASQARVEELGAEVRLREERIGELDRAVAARDETIRDQEHTIAAQGEQILALDAALELLKVDHRLAEIEVLGQESAEGGTVQTRVRFVELGPDGAPLGEGVEATVDGRTVYVETLVIKFDDRFVQEGDALRGTSICLFRRLFGENQRPIDGVELDPAGQQPLVYAGEGPQPPLHRDLWNRFWEYANDPELAHERGVRAIHGEAPFIELRQGKRYRIELRSSGGLTIRTME